jgi:chaperonin GroES
MAFDLENAPYETNLADFLDELELAAIGKDLVRQIDIDEESRKEWMDTNKTWLKLASQVREDKNFPWQGASNVKYPLLTIASMQFNARALPNLVNSAMPVQARIIGRDGDQEKLRRSLRVETYMGYQLLEEMPEWLDEMDRLLFVLPMVGICYKKTYYSSITDRLKSTLILPNDMIVNYHAKSFERARMTEVMYVDSNELYEQQARGVYLDLSLQAPSSVSEDRNAADDIGQKTPSVDSDMDTYRIYESHCWLDLDDDGYKEPYVVTLTEKGEVLRIAARWSQEGVNYNDNGKVARIEPDVYFVPYIFMPDPSSAVSGLGLGSLLGPINEAVNTLINQLTDAGTLSVLQGGFMGRGINLRAGSMRFRPGEWKMINATGDDIRKSIFPMPIKEPSSTLFQLLGMLVESGERLSAVSEMMIGENPGQNQPATTTMAVLEQGLKVFTSIYKRIHRSLAKEYKILYRLNGIYLNEEMYNNILDDERGPFTIEDFNGKDMNIRPASDPSIVSQAQKSVKSKSLLEKLAMGLPLNVAEVTKRSLEAEEHEDIEKLMETPPPQPNPEIQLKTQEMQLKAQEMQMKAQLDQMKVQLESMKIKSKAALDETGAQLNVAKAKDLGHQAQLGQRGQQLAEVEAQANQMIKMLEMQMGQKGKEQNETTEK